MKASFATKPYLVLQLTPKRLPIELLEYCSISSFNVNGEFPMDTSIFQLVHQEPNFRQYEYQSTMHFDVLSDLDNVLFDFILLSKPNYQNVVIFGDISHCDRTINLLKEYSNQLVPAFGVQPILDDQILQLTANMSGYYTLQTFNEFCFFKPEIDWFIRLVLLQFLKLSHIVKVKSEFRSVFHFDEQTRLNFIKLHESYKHKLLVDSTVIVNDPTEVIGAALPLPRNDFLFYDLINKHNMFADVEIRKVSGGYIGTLMLNREIYVTSATDVVYDTFQECSDELFNMGYEKLKSDSNLKLSPFQLAEYLLQIKNLDELVFEESFIDGKVQLKFIVGFSEFTCNSLYSDLDTAKNEVSKLLLSYLYRNEYSFSAVDSVELSDEFLSFNDKKRDTKSHISLLKGICYLYRILSI